MGRGEATFSSRWLTFEVPGMGGMTGDFRQVVAILHRRHGRHPPHGIDLLDADLGESDMTDLSFTLQIEQRTDLILERNLVVDAVKLIEIDSLELETLETSLTRFAEMLWTSVRDPRVGTGPL